MNLDELMIENLEWNSEIVNKEEKEVLANKIANRVREGEVVGFGSGSTSFLAVCAIAKKLKKEKLNITAIPTSFEIKLICSKLGIPTCTILEKKPDWCFDGADEVNKNNWLIKGRGAAMFKEKLNIVNSKETYILVDKTKIVNSLGKKMPVPVECYPEAVNYVKNEIKKLGAKETIMRLAKKKDGPVITENNNIILDCKFDKIEENLEKRLKLIPGVIETGLFIGYNIKIETI